VTEIAFAFIKMKPKKLKSFRDDESDAIPGSVQLLMNLAKPLASSSFLPPTCL